MEKDRDFKNPLLHYTSTTSNASTSFSTNKNIRPTSKQIKQFCFPQLNKIAEKKEKKNYGNHYKDSIGFNGFHENLIGCNGYYSGLCGSLLVCVGFY